MRAGTPAGLALLALSTLGWWTDPVVFLAVWLAAAWWAVGLVLGAFVNVWMHRLTGGAWGERLRPIALAVAPRLPWLLLAFVPVIVGLRQLYPWAADPHGAWLEPIKQPAFLLAWLSPPFFVVRIVLYALAWSWLCRLASLASKGRAAASLIVHALVSSLAAVDLVMSLMPAWYSTGFALGVLAAQALGGAALLVLLATGSLHEKSVSRDLGNLLLMWALSWAYLAFMQFLIIWAENLPREISWYLPRLQGGWRFAALALVLLQLVVPALALLFRSVKDRPGRLRAVAALLLCASALDSLWVVLPSVAPHSLHGWWLAPLTFGGMALLLVPTRGPRLMEVTHADA